MGQRGKRGEEESQEEEEESSKRRRWGFRQREAEWDGATDGGRGGRGGSGGRPTGSRGMRHLILIHLMPAGGGPSGGTFGSIEPEEKKGKE